MRLAFLLALVEASDCLSLETLLQKHTVTTNKVARKVARRALKDIAHVGLVTQRSVAQAFEWEHERAYRYERSGAHSCKPPDPNSWCICSGIIPAQFPPPLPKQIHPSPAAAAHVAADLECVICRLGRPSHSQLWQRGVAGARACDGRADRHARQCVSASHSSPLTRPQFLFPLTLPPPVAALQDLTIELRPCARSRPVCVLWCGCAEHHSQHDHSPDRRRRRLVLWDRFLHVVHRLESADGAPGRQGNGRDSQHHRCGHERADARDGPATAT